MLTAETTRNAVGSDQSVEAVSGGRQRLSILAVTSQVPWPLNSGGHLRTYHLLTSLAKHSRVRLISTVVDADPNAVEPLESKGIEVMPVPVGRRTRWGEAQRLFRAVRRGEPYVLYHRHYHQAVRAALQWALRDDPPDLLYLDHLDSFLYCPARLSVPTLVDMHNVYSTLLKRTAEEHGLPMRWFLRRESDRVAKQEREAASRASALFAVSEQDADHFRAIPGACSVHVVPNGVDCKALADLPIVRSTTSPRILFLGALSWAPNVSASLFLARNVFPRFRAEFPDSQLWIVGREPTAEVAGLSSQAGVHVYPNVPSIKPYLEKASALAVPLDSGGGTRLKILEAFAAGLPVISTAVGCEGLAVTAGEHLLVAERDTFLQGLLAMHRDQGSTQYRAEVGRGLALRSYDWHSIGDKVHDLVEELCAQKPGN